jgi:hypothetical protein
VRNVNVTDKNKDIILKTKLENGILTIGIPLEIARANVPETNKRIIQIE